MDSPTRSRSAVVLVVKGAALLMVAYATAAAIVAFVPEVNDYAKASVLKHDRLSAISGRRIVIIGGSNVAYGVDSAVIEQATGCATVNMGMNGRLGMRFLLEETRPHLRPGDVAVAAFEYDGFYYSIDGDYADQLMIVKANPPTFAYLDWSQREALVYAVPYVAQQKLVRLTKDAYYTTTNRLLGNPPGAPPLVDMDVIESFRGFNHRGDLVSHLGVTWPGEHEDGVDMTREEMDPLTMPLLTEFARSMKTRGVDVLLSYTSVMRSYYERHRSAIDRLHETITESTPLVVPSPPETFVYDDGLFFDTVYHLNAEGRERRSIQIAQDIGRALGTATPCRVREPVATSH